jgi:GNAT superfamily N-acetyltransferase
MTASLRDATEGDAAALAELWRGAGLVFAAGHARAELASVRRQHPGLLLVAEDERGIAPAVLGTCDGRRGWVNRLATRPDVRGQGLAFRLMATLEARLVKDLWEEDLNITLAVKRRMKQLTIMMNVNQYEIPA